MSEVDYYTGNKVNRILDSMTLFFAWGLSVAMFLGVIVGLPSLIGASDNPWYILLILPFWAVSFMIHWVIVTIRDRQRRFYLENMRDVINRPYTIRLTSPGADDVR